MVHCHGDEKDDHEESSFHVHHAARRGNHNNQQQTLVIQDSRVQYCHPTEGAFIQGAYSQLYFFDPRGGREGGLITAILPGLLTGCGGAGLHNSVKLTQSRTIP